MRDIVLINLVKRFLNTYEILALNQAKLNQQFSELLPKIAGSNKISSEDKLNLTNKSISIFKNLDNALQIKINDSKTTLTDYARFLEHQLTTRTLMIKDNYEWEYIDSINELEFSATQLIQAQNNLLLDANSSTLMNGYNNDKNRNKIAEKERPNKCVLRRIFFYGQTNNPPSFENKGWRAIFFMGTIN